MADRIGASFGKALAAAFMALAMAACSTTPREAAPSAGARPHFKIGQPYQVNGRWYHPHEDPTYDRVGVASWYGDEFHGKPTANGERFDKTRLSAAHTTLPLPSIVEVQNLENGRTIVVRLNDRGPFIGDRIIDLSHAAARELGFEGQGLARVRVRYLGRAELAALAPRPGERGAQRMLAAAPAASPVPTAPPPPDIIAQLIGEADAAYAGAARANAAPGAGAGEIWIDVRRFGSLADLDAAQAVLDAMGPARVRALPPAEGAAYLLQLGPYQDIVAAEARLAALREAGYSEARIADGRL